MNDKELIKAKSEELIALTSEFCDKFLNEEYKQLCEKIIRKMSRKRDVPFLTGRPTIWAASIIYAIGSINFLFDKSFEPYVKGEDIAAYFGTSPSTVAQKAKVIRDMFKLWYFDDNFSTQRNLEASPLRKMAMRGGFILMND